MDLGKSAQFSPTIVQLFCDGKVPDVDQEMVESI
jgi:hypothetical protein